MTDSLLSHYALLEVPPTASTDEIKRAYRAKAKQYHPDLNQGDRRTVEHMIRLNQARDIVCARRAAVA